MSAPISPRTTARLAGVLWLACIVLGMIGFALTAPLITRADAAATATNVVGSESLFRLGLVGNLLSGAAYLGVTGLLFAVLKPANRAGSFCAACFGIAGVAFSAVWPVAGLTALKLASGAPAAFVSAQAQELALASIFAGDQVFKVAMVFFGVHILLIGWLILRATFLPRAFGVLLTVGGALYVISSAVGLVAPGIGARLSPFIMGLALLGEGSLTVWLLARGVDGERWHRQNESGILAERVAMQA